MTPCTPEIWLFPLRTHYLIHAVPTELLQGMNGRNQRMTGMYTGTVHFTDVKKGKERVFTALQVEQMKDERIKGKTKCF